MKRILILLCALLPIVGFAQSESAESKFNIEAGYTHSFGISDTSNDKSISDYKSAMYANSWRGTALYNINTKFTAGIGMDFASVEEPSYSYSRFVPFASLRYKPFDGKWNNLYAFVNLGYSIRTNDGYRSTPGFMAEVGVGYTKMFAKHFGVFGQVGYSLNRISYREVDIDGSTGDIMATSKVTSYRNSVFVSAGVVF